MTAAANVQRSIPAYAGEPGLNSGGSRDDEVYPRVCGGTRDVGVFLDPPYVYPRVCGGTLCRSA